jgi:hypothetical protein
MIWDASYMTSKHADLEKWKDFLEFVLAVFIHLASSIVFSPGLLHPTITTCLST